MSWQLGKEASAALKIKAALVDDDELANDCIEGETNLFEEIDKALIKEVEYTEAAESMKRLSKVYKDRETAFKAKAAKIKPAILEAMKSLDLKTIKRDVGTVTIVGGKPGFIIKEVNRIPSCYTKEVDSIPDRDLISDAIKGGFCPQGVTEITGDDYLTIRRK